MRYSFVTLLATEAYLAGVLVLWHSLRKSGSAHDLLVLITYKASPDTLSLLDNLRIDYTHADRIPSPHRHEAKNPLYYMFDKLTIFGLIEYDKVVYLDADMLVCRNIDDLFERPSWSAVNTGGMLPEYAHWKQFNAGLMVIEPDLGLFSDLLRQKDRLPSSDGGDQGFLHAYFPEWPQRPEFHLDHAYNMCAGFVSRYCELFGYTLPDQVGTSQPGEKEIKVLHYWAHLKPWRRGKHDGGANDLETRVYRLWWTCLEDLVATEDLRM